MKHESPLEFTSDEIQSRKFSLIISSDYQYTSCTDYVSQLCGYKNNTHIQGTSPFNIKCKAVECMPEFYKQDLQVFRDKSPLTVFNINIYDNSELKCLLTQKDPIFNPQGQVIGIEAISEELNENKLSSFVETIFHYASKKTMRQNYQFSYTIVDAYTEHGLTSSESVVLFLCAHGKSMKQCAALLSRSPRTIETLLNQVKFKLHLQNKAQLIEYAIFTGLIFCIPRRAISSLL